MTKAWDNLTDHKASIAKKTIASHFADEDKRAEAMSLQAGDIFIDYSKQRLDEQGLELLFELAREREVEKQRDAMFAGEKINTTEDRAVLHVALRNPSDSHVTADGDDVMPQINEVKKRMAEFACAVHDGAFKGFTGNKINHVVNIGIGGSDLGPRMACEALTFYSDRERDIHTHFVSNVDGTDIAETLKGLKPEETLFIISSKSFTTDETMTNAHTAKEWLLEEFDDEQAIKNHFVAVSTNETAVAEFGIDPNNMFEFWDWVGGRYSLPSAIGLSLMIELGPEQFNEFLDGYHKMDEHFRTAPLESNAPVILALISLWNNNFLGASSEAVIPYSRYLRLLPSYLQQMIMESNGKSVTKDGELVKAHTSPVVWGGAGTDAQHSFFQLLHQGTRFIPVDFIGVKETNNPIDKHHAKLTANMLAQSSVLAFGLSEKQLKDKGVDEKLVPHKRMPGNRPSNTILLEHLTPSQLGQLIALYEHKTFVQGAIWGINSFDQFGVEHGKVMAKEIFNSIDDGLVDESFDESTKNLLKKLL